MVVHDLDLVSIARSPDETDPPLVVDTDAVLTLAVPLECFKPIARGAVRVNVFTLKFKLAPQFRTHYFAQRLDHGLDLWVDLFVSEGGGGVAELHA